MMMWKALVHVRKLKLPTKDKRVEKIVNKLKETHADTHQFSQMQYRIWAEMINSGIYSSMEDPPSTSMFKRAGPMKITSSSHSPAKI